jgi:hypothetical protein
MIQSIVPDPEKHPIIIEAIPQVICGLETPPLWDRNQDGRFGLDEAFHFGDKFRKQSSC